MPASLAPHPMTVDEMLDKAALEQLNFTYCHAVDRQDYALVRSLYHDDATDDHGPMFRGSADGYVAWLPTILSKWQLSAHRLTNMLFLVDGDAAEGEVCFTAYHRHRDGEREWVAHGRYLDRYAKRDGIWRYAHRTVVLDWNEKRASVPRPTDGTLLGAPDANDPIYAQLPMFAGQRA
ncbi:nuclear transport factor 2 family protein [Sphingomonas crocodyli]|nr:nuclear transport factor 2 family protein [Sphingomonas crocodyli]